MEDENFFEIVLLDIKESIKNNYDFKCITENLYNPELIYCAISYRWGFVNEWEINTPDYVSYVTSLPKVNLSILCKNLNKISINYIWIDSICINQKDEEKKKETIYRMNYIYKKAYKIFSVPDLGFMNIGIMEKININDKTVHPISYFKKQFNIYYSIYKDLEDFKNIHKVYEFNGVFKNYEAIKNDINEYRDIIVCNEKKKYIENYRKLKEHMEAKDIEFFNKLEEYGVGTKEYVNDFKNVIEKYLGKDIYIERLEKLNELKSYENNYIHNYKSNKNIYDNITNYLYEERNFFNFFCEYIYGYDIIKKYVSDVVTIWKNRVWIISEFSIGIKNDSIFMFLIKTETYIKISEEKKKEKEITTEEIEGIYNLSENIIYVMNKDIYKSLYDITIKDPYNIYEILNTILFSESTNIEDRIYAIFPHSKYNNPRYIKEILNYWEINDIMDLKISLLKFFDVKNKYLLFPNTNNTKNVNNLKLVVNDIDKICTNNLDFVKINSEYCIVIKTKFYNFISKNIVILYLYYINDDFISIKCKLIDDEWIMIEKVKVDKIKSGVVSLTNKKTGEEVEYIKERKYPDILRLENNNELKFIIKKFINFIH